MTATLDAPGPAAAAAAPGGSLPALLLDRAVRAPTRVALRKKTLGRWKPYTWADYAERAAAVGLGLRALGVAPGDRVAIHSENRPAWLFADLGAQGISAVSVGVYPTSPASELEYLLTHSGARVLIAEDEEQVDKALAVRGRAPALEHIVVIDPRGVDMTDPQLRSLAELEALGRGRSDTSADGTDLVAAFATQVAAVDPGAPAVIVYTSGTTGPPKGAMLSQRNLLAAAAGATEVFGVGERDEVLSYLPLCHVAERLVSAINGVAAGYVVNFGEGGDALQQDLREVQPTFFLGVPRVWEKLLAGIQIRMGDATRTKRIIYRFWMKQGERLAAKRWKGRLNPIDTVWARLGWLMVHRSLREKIGMARVRGALSGAAPIAPQVLEYFWALGVPVREGYGQTENTAQATITPVDDVRIGTVGVAIAGCELRIAPDGEILTRGEGTFLGYFENPEATAETIDADGWLHTGDVGVLDADGYLTITDRKKDIIITAGGKNISPSEIENKLKVSPWVKEAVVIGDRRKYLTALIGIELDTVGNWAQRHKIAFTTYTDLAAKPEVVELVQAWVDEVNRDLAQVETVKRIALLPRELDQDEGEVTATQKVKRRAIETRYAALIEGLYS